MLAAQVATAQPIAFSLGKQDHQVTCIQLFQRDFILKEFHKSVGFPGGSDGKESACSVGDPGSIPGSGRSPGEGNGNPLQYSCLENPMDRGAWQATVHEAAKSCSRLNNFTHFNFTNLYSWCNFTLNKFHQTLFKSRTVWNFEKV